MPNRQNFRPARETIGANKSKAPQNLQVPIEDGNYGMLLIFKEYSYRAPGSSGLLTEATTTGGDTIFLPLPENIQDNFDVRVARFDQGTAGAIVSQVLSESTSGGQNLSSIMDASRSALVENLPKLATDGAEAFNAGAEIIKALTGGAGDTSALDRFSEDAGFLLRKLPLGNFGRSVDAGLGTTLNPKAALSFEGVEMKSHNFNWTVAPKSDQESQNLRNIIKTINKNILPEYVEGELAQKAMFRYPSTVDIFFVGLDSNFYYFFKTAMVKTFNINYTPNGVSVLKGGRPAAVQMTMNVIETDIHTAEDYSSSNVDSLPTVQ